MNDEPYRGQPKEDVEPYRGQPKPDKPALLSRREFIRNTVRLAVAGALIPGALAQLLPTVAPDALGGSGPGPVILRDPRTNARIPVTLSDLAGDAPVVVTAEWNFLPAVVYKVKNDILQASSKKRGYNTAQFALAHPDGEHTILLYDGKCKHLGCTVGFLANKPASKDIADYNEDGFNDGGVLCPCHQGQYDIYDLAVNIPGTPPPAPLNVIEFDLQNFTDDVTGESFSEVIFGLAKHLQDDYRDAHEARDALYPATNAQGDPFKLDDFSARTPGWSA